MWLSPLIHSFDIRVLVPPIWQKLRVVHLIIGTVTYVVFPRLAVLRGWFLCI